MYRFFTSNINSPNIVLSEEESAHAIRVMRLQKGDTILLLDGNGSSMQATILDANAKRCLVATNGISEIENVSNGKLHIAIAPTKNLDRLEWFVEKATEIGIYAITPIISAKTERRNLNVDRLNKILVSAMKQSQRLYLPILKPITNIQNFAESVGQQPLQKFIAHCQPANKKYFATEVDKALDCIMLIGPEGDFTVQEIECAINNGFVQVNLGNARLRTETAGIYTTSVFNG